MFRRICVEKQISTYIYIYISYDQWVFVQRLKEIANKHQILTLFLLSWEPESIICKPYMYINNIPDVALSITHDSLWQAITSILNPQ